MLAFTAFSRGLWLRGYRTQGYLAFEVKRRKFNWSAVRGSGVIALRVIQFFHASVIGLLGYYLLRLEASRLHCSRSFCFL